MNLSSYTTMCGNVLGLDVRESVRIILFYLKKYISVQMYVNITRTI